MKNFRKKLLILLADSAYAPLIGIVIAIVLLILAITLVNPKQGITLFLSIIVVAVLNVFIYKLGFAISKWAKKRVDN